MTTVLACIYDTASLGEHLSGKPENVREFELTADREMSGNKSCGVVANFTFGATVVFSRLLQATMCSMFEGFCCLLNHCKHSGRTFNNISSVLLVLTMIYA